MMGGEGGRFGLGEWGGRENERRGRGEYRIEMFMNIT